jgi:magnesium chelatase family protein
LTVHVAAVPPSELQDSTPGEASADIRGRVLVARDGQLARDGKLNARLQGRSLKARSMLSRSARAVMARALSQLALSARGYDRTLRVARTIADLGGADVIDAEHLAEALHYRGE